MFGFDSQAVWGMVRLDLHMIRKFDFVGELRVLSTTEARDLRSGFLTAIYYHLDKYIKVGIGYNFTDFSNNLNRSFLLQPWVVYKYRWDVLT